YAGLWYEAYQHDINEVDTQCENGTYTANSNGTMDVWSQGLNKLSGYYSHRGLAKPKKESEPAAFLIHYTNPSNALHRNKTLPEPIVEELKKVLKHMHAKSDDINPTLQGC
ncbi:unnamed protein product, partial [Rotaria sp. Silwood1]